MEDDDKTKAKTMTVEGCDKVKEVKVHAQR